VDFLALVSSGDMDKTPVPGVSATLPDYLHLHYSLQNARAMGIVALVDNPRGFHSNEAVTDHNPLLDWT
jgi:hypothetical protein